MYILITYTNFYVYNNVYSIIYYIRRARHVEIFTGIFHQTSYLQSVELLLLKIEN